MERRAWLRSRSTGVSKRFGADARRRRPRLTIGDGEFVVLLGPTGAGKTTTLRLVAGPRAPRRRHDPHRRPRRDRAPAGGARRHLRLPAIFALSASLRLRQSRLPAALAGAARAGGRDRASASRRSPSCCASTTSCKNRATQLSGGEMQRVAIGRALVRRPAIYLMDEPLSSLDAKLRADLRLELKHIQQDLGATILYVTHDQIEAMTMANRIGVIDEGRLVQIGTPREIYESPTSLYVADAARPAGDQPDAAPACFPDGGAPPARRPSARAPSTSASPRRRTASSHGDGRLDRASRRPEPPACDASASTSSSRWPIPTPASTSATR